MDNVQKYDQAAYSRKHRAGLKMDLGAIKALLEDLRADVADVRTELAQQQRGPQKEQSKCR